MKNIHETAIITGNVKIHPSVKIGPYCILDGDIIIGENTNIISHVNIVGKVVIGQGNIIYPNTSIGFKCQDVEHIGSSETTVEIGDFNQIRENVTIHRGTEHGIKTTKIGNHNLLMSMVHIAHDCIIANNVIISNGSQLAGHVEVDDEAIIGGMSGVLQFVHIGRNAMIGGMSRIDGHVLPFSLVKVNVIDGVNIVGLKRKNFEYKRILAVKDMINMFADHKINYLQVCEELGKIKSEDANVIVDFCKNLPLKNVGMMKFSS